MERLRTSISALAGPFESFTEADILSRLEPVDVDRVQLLGRYNYPAPKPLNGVLIVDSLAYRLLACAYGEQKTLDTCYGCSKSIYYTDKWMEDLMKRTLQSALLKASRLLRS